MSQAQQTAQALRQGFEAVVIDLLNATKASRTTIRIDLPQVGFDVENPAAEACLDDTVLSLLGQPALNQRALNTVQWLDAHRKCLIQESCKDADPAPPQALMDVYGVKAQMLGPIERDGQLIAWISVHENRTTRAWTKEEIAALEDALAKVNAILDTNKV